MELFNPNTNKHFDAPQDWPSEKKRKALAKISQMRLNEWIVLEREYADVVQVRRAAVIESRKRVEENLRQWKADVPVNAETIVAHTQAIVKAAETLLDEVLEELLEPNDELRVRNQDYDEQRAEVNIRASLRSCQASLTTRQMPVETAQLIDSDVDGPFWQEQSVPAAQEAVTTFSLAYAKRRSGSRGDKAVAGDDRGSAPVEALGAEGIPGTDRAVVNGVSA